MIMIARLLDHLKTSNLFLADSRFSRISGRSPFLTELFTNISPVGVLMKSSGERLMTHNHFKDQLKTLIIQRHSECECALVIFN